MEEFEEKTEEIWKVKKNKAEKGRPFLASYFSAS